MQISHGCTYIYIEATPLSFIISRGKYTFRSHRPFWNTILQIHCIIHIFVRYFNFCSFHTKMQSCIMYTSIAIKPTYALLILHTKGWSWIQHQALIIQGIVIIAYCTCMNTSVMIVWSSHVMERNTSEVLAGLMKQR